MAETAAIRWRRLDGPGHDACRLVVAPAGWRLEGQAVFAHEGAPAELAYSVDCDSAWHTQTGAVRGRIGGHLCDLRIARAADGRWILNGRLLPPLPDCVDLDLGFAPATNLIQLRRIALQVGQGADVPVAWLDAPAGTLERLHQRYERRTIEDYWRGPSIRIPCRAPGERRRLRGELSGPVGGRRMMSVPCGDGLR